MKRNKKDRPLRRGRRYPLLLQRRLNEMVFWPAILITILSAGLLIWNPPEMGSARPYFTIILLGSAGVLVVTLLFRLRAYARCGPQSVWIQLPFYHLEVPYRVIRTTRPSELFRLFPAKQQSAMQRNFLRGLLGTTAVILQVEELPWSRHFLRLWASKYMFCPDAPGLVISVHDWLGFRNELDEFKARSHRA